MENCTQKRKIRYKPRDCSALNGRADLFSTNAWSSKLVFLVLCYTNLALAMLKKSGHKEHQTEVKLLLSYTSQGDMGTLLEQAAVAYTETRGI